MSSIRKRKRRVKSSPSPDARKQLSNDGAVGPIEKIQVSTERITRINGILFDLDPALLNKSLLIPSIPTDPATFYTKVVSSWLGRHPVLDKAEVRISGTGLHIIPWIVEPIEFDDEGARERWCGIVQVVQSVLPTDPHAPGITATTRALGSVNAKCGQEVKRIKKGRGVTADEVLQLYEQMCAAPFKTVVEMLTGSDCLTPCPFCREEDQTLKAINYVGECYGSCGRVTFEQLGNLLFGDKSTEKDAKRDGRKSK